LLVKIFYSVGFHLFSPVSLCTYTIAQKVQYVKV
jgi:hypothetical protein